MYNHIVFNLASLYMACCSLLQREELRDVSEGWSGSLVEAEKKWGEDCEDLRQADPDG
ncbi:hypothetical protein NQZ68_005930 [Dissostichus eleginoides]|nr:hypothetical protein NQZ68_005930 [Dissostichus eleginoides]